MRGRLLLVDDEPTSLSMLEALLAPLDHELLRATSGPAGLGLFNERSPDLVLLDLTMPGMDGLDVLAGIRAHPTRGDTPVILVSGRSGRGDRLQGLEAGADDFLEKPVDEAILLARVRTLLRLKELREALTRSRDELAARNDSEGRFRAMLEKSGEGIVLLGADGTTLYASPAVSRLLGAPQSGSPVEIHPDDRGAMAEGFLWLKANPGQSRVEHYRARHADGTWRWFESTATSLLHDPAVGAVVRNFRDVTERRALAAELVQAQKMEAVGRLAGGIAHDFNNVLSAVIAYSHMCIDATSADDPMHQDLLEILHAGERAAELTQQLLAFSRKQILQPQVLALSAIVEEVLKMLRRVIAEDIVLVTQPEPSLWTVSADPGQITQVLVNLVLNARDAMPSGGRLTIQTRNAELGKAEAAQLGVHPGPHVAVVMTDTGVGMDKETLGHLFEPFFTTKEQGKGTGLGLATAFGIVKQSGGALSAESEPGRGATFTVYLPRVDAAISTGQHRVRSLPPTRGGGTVLVVEDDASVGEALRRLLVDRGFEVLVARNMTEALTSLEKLATSVRFVMTDVVMPGGDGFSLARRARELSPGLPFLFMSGYPDHPGIQDPDIDFLPKPFTPAQLDDALRAIAGVSGTWRTDPRPVRMTV